VAEVGVELITVECALQVADSTLPTMRNLLAIPCRICPVLPAGDFANGDSTFTNP
jgi:hypothetical protein